MLLRRVGDLAEDATLGRLAGEREKVRRYSELRYAATSWKTERRVTARVEAGADSSVLDATIMPQSAASRSQTAPR